MTDISRVFAALGIAAMMCLPMTATVSAQAARSLPARLAPATRDSLRSAIDSAQAAGIPAEPLYAKIDEGLLKGANDSVIVAAVRALTARLRDVIGVLGTSSSTGDLLAGASALKAGLTPAQLRRLREARIAGGTGARGSLAGALVTAADLASRGVPSGRAVDALVSLLARNASDDILLWFRRDVDREISRGIEPGMAAQSTLEAIGASLPHAGVSRPP